MSLVRVAFRVDASNRIGTGHFMRCLTLAETFRTKGVSVRFISRDLPGHLQLMVRKTGCELIVLKSDKTKLLPDESHHSHWLGTTQDKDASETIEALSGYIWDWLVVDHYAIDQQWETLVAPSVKRLMVVDDLADRLHRCDLLLDQNLVGDLDTRYDGKVPELCRLLLGPKYALLQRDYLEVPGDRATFKESIHRILVFFGGADQHNLTGRSVSAVIALDRPDIKVDVVLSTGSPHEDAIRRQVQGHENVHLHSNLPSLAPLMRQADLAIGAGGTTSWERLCIGLPALVVTLAGNQRPIAAELHRRQLIRWLGDEDDVDELDFLKALRELVAQGALQNSFLDGRQVVDGKGVDRVLEAMTVAYISPLRIRRATIADEATLLEWANDPITRAHAFSGSQITPQAHRQWLLSRLENIASCRIYILETGEGKAFGQIRFELSGAAWVVDYSLSPGFRGLGLGRRLLEVGLSQLRSEEADAIVFGEVKVENVASRKVFESLGFSILSDEAATVKYISQVTSSDMARLAIVIATPHTRHDHLELQVRHDLPGYEVVRIRSREDLTFNTLKQIKPRFVFFPHWSWLIPEDVYSGFDCVIFHMTDLPYGRGGSPLQNLIVRGNCDTMLSAFKCVKELDAGPLYLKRPLSLLGTAEEILQQAADLTAKMIVEIVEKQSPPLPQKGAVVEFKRRQPEDGDLSRLEGLQQVYDHIRMLDAVGYPQAFLKTGSFQFQFSEARMGEEFIEAKVLIRRKLNE